jgi:hypothetical protein
LGLERKVTILDEYDCVVMPDKIRISIDSPRDASLSDIMSEIHFSDGNIYFDGSYYEYSGRYDILEDWGADGRLCWYLDLYF